MPANCDTQVRKIEEYIKISNKKSKAGNIASSLNKWKEITSNKWKEIQIFLDKKYKIYFKKVQLSQLQIMNEGTFSLHDPRCQHL